MKDSGWCIWLTGLPCSGKTTLARALSKYLRDRNIDHHRLDGDITREWMSKDLGFTPQDRNANINRVLGLATYLTKECENVICSYISPYETMRQAVKQLIPNTLIIFIDCPADVCAERDVKGMWKKAMNGEIENFTGIDAPYEIPREPDLLLHTHQWDIPLCLASIINLMEGRDFIYGRPA